MLSVDFKTTYLYSKLETEEYVHMPYQCQIIIEMPEMNKLYYKYKSNIETIVLHPEMSSLIAGT
jgi:hypothetical protein